MIFHFRQSFPLLNAYWDKYLPLQKRQSVPAKKVLLEEGKRSQHYMYIEKGCLRVFINKDGTDKTIQFFFEQEGLSSLDNFVNNVPSPCSIEPLSPRSITLCTKSTLCK